MKDCPRCNKGTIVTNIFRSPDGPSGWRVRNGKWYNGPSHKYVRYTCERCGYTQEENN